MYETFEDAAQAARRVINRYYAGDKMNCVIVETKTSRGTWFNFRFHSTDTNGEWVNREHGVFERRTLI